MNNKFKTLFTKIDYMYEEQIYKIGFSGHREDYLEKLKKEKNIDYKKSIYDFLNESLKNIKKEKIEFNIGGANGFDTIIGLYCLEKNIKYNLFLPYRDIEKQIKYWNKKQKEDFFNIYKNILCKKINYFNGYFERNREIVNNSDILIVGYLDLEKSGTKYTMNYAQKQGLLTKNIFKK